MGKRKMKLNKIDGYIDTGTNFLHRALRDQLCNNINDPLYIYLDDINRIPSMQIS